MQAMKDRGTSDRRILVVDDDYLNATDAADALRLAGYTQTRIARDADTAIHEAGEHQPDLVLMDVKMPGERDGIDAAEVISDQYNIPVVFLTAFAHQPRNRERARQAGAIGVIPKPVEDDELVSRLEGILRRALALLGEQLVSIRQEKAPEREGLTADEDRKLARMQEQTERCMRIVRPTPEEAEEALARVNGRRLELIRKSRPANPLAADVARELARLQIFAERCLQVILPLPNDRVEQSRSKVGPSLGMGGSGGAT